MAAPHHTTPLHAMPMPWVPHLSLFFVLNGIRSLTIFNKRNLLSNPLLLSFFQRFSGKFPEILEISTQCGTLHEVKNDLREDERRERAAIDDGGPRCARHGAGAEPETRASAIAHRLRGKKRKRSSGHRDGSVVGGGT